MASHPIPSHCFAFEYFSIVKPTAFLPSLVPIWHFHFHFHFHLHIHICTQSIHPLSSFPPAQLSGSAGNHAHMYPSSSSSSQSHNSTISETGLTRYGSAPGSLLRTAVDAVIGGSRPLGVGVGVGVGVGAGVGVGVGVGAHYFSVESSESTCKVNNNSSPSDPKEQKGELQRSYGLQEAFGGSSSSALLRQRSSPAGFLSNLATSALPHDIGISLFLFSFFFFFLHFSFYFL